MINGEGSKTMSDECDDVTSSLGSEWPAVAGALYELFVELTGRGFSEDQAIQLISGALQATPTES